MWGKIRLIPDQNKAQRNNSAVICDPFCNRAWGSLVKLYVPQKIIAQGNNSMKCNPFKKTRSRSLKAMVSKKKQSTKFSKLFYWNDDIMSPKLKKMNLDNLNLSGA
jgi:hypothetical protein